MEVEGNHPQVVQAIAQALRRGFAGVGEHSGEDGAVQPDKAGQPRENGVQERPDDEGYQYAHHPFLVEGAGFLAHGEQEHTGQHDKQGDARTQERSVDASPEIVFRIRAGFG